MSFVAELWPDSTHVWSAGTVLSTLASIHVALHAGDAGSVVLDHSHTVPAHRQRAGCELKEYSMAQVCFD